MAVPSNVIEIVKNKKLARSFEPNMKTLSTILEVLTVNGSKGKTDLSFGITLSYTRLAKHIVWMEKKGLVKSTVDTSEINVGLTKKGKIFTSTILD